MVEWVGCEIRVPSASSAAVVVGRGQQRIGNRMGNYVVRSPSTNQEYWHHIGGSSWGRKLDYGTWDDVVLISDPLDSQTLP